MENFNQNDLNRPHDFLASCMPLCPLECNLTEYKTSMSSMRLLGHALVDHILSRGDTLTRDLVSTKTSSSAGSLSAEQASLSSVALNVFYDSLSYTMSTESPQMNVVSLLASIGGTLSLFLGLSVFSLLEIGQIVVGQGLRSINFCKKKRTRNKNKNVTTKLSA